ncbi:3,4-dihydroxy-2-butanone-4-phosphate synthase [Candidatus Woesearchaeota archaeon]|nr:3,4-dihydroxy-2-butanone-4-phosphate synthase [Candidatus Woesearchaeota archaeon]
MYSSIPEAITLFKQGTMIIVIDETRECESDLILAAEYVTEEKITFMIKNTSGILTVPLTKQRGEELKLPLMVQDNTEKHGTNFTVSVDALDPAMTTGVSSHDRTITIQKLVSGTAQNLARPGHIFPLISRDSLFERQGHTEASITLCRLAGLKDVAIISELMNDNGTMMNQEQTFEFAKEHDLRVISIQQIINYLKE